MRKRIGGLLLLQLLVMSVKAQDYALHYTVGLDTVNHYLNVRLDYTAQDGNDSQELVLNMPVWTPGYYEILNFPKHLCDFSANDPEGQPLTRRKDGSTTHRCFWATTT